MSNSFQEKIKNLPKEKIIYPSIIVLYFIILVTTFYFIVSFISQQINLSLNPISADQEGQLLTSLNLSGFNRVMKKLGLDNSNTNSTNTPNPVASSSPANISTNTPIDTASSTIATIASSTPEKIVDYTISIINSTKKSGLASKLQSVLQAQGFNIKTVANQTTLEKISLMKVKPELDQTAVQFQKLKNIVSQQYNITIDKLDNTSQADIEIIIGNN